MSAAMILIKPRARPVIEHRGNRAHALAAQISARLPGRHNCRMNPRVAVTPRDDSFR